MNRRWGIGRTRSLDSILGGVTTLLNELDSFVVDTSDQISTQESLIAAAEAEVTRLSSEQARAVSVSGNLRSLLALK